MEKIRKLLTPLFFRFIIIIEIFHIIHYYTGYIFYKYSILCNKVYIGGYMFSRQEIARGRHKILRNILNLVVKKKIKNKKKTIEILEIGSFCGESTIMMGNFLLKKKIPFKITCVDVWSSFSLESYSDFFLVKINENLKNGKVFSLFKHNIKNSGFSKNIKVIKGDSNIVLKNIKKKFDLIFIDGSHSYKYVFNDIKNSIKILNNNSYLVGDDYEIPYNKTKHLNYTKLIKENIDCIYDYKNKMNMHPGVTLAVNKFFGSIPSRNGLFVKQLKKKYANITESI